jgi:dTDP-3-amino-2,3,6-trideoxy-4-keto-D-glucose/dTDP-3-amino-3,4,6-trideoxy-alpha-D-glucose/dTDP-2,6-dideoxy-D-kanosamine transaminase
MPSSSRPELDTRGRAPDLPAIPLRAGAAADEVTLDELLETVACIALSGRFVGGSAAERLEQRLAWLHGHRYAVAVRSGDEAARLALAVLGVGPGARVALPAACPPSLERAVAALGARAVWIPVDPWSACVTEAGVRSALAAAPACLVVVHLFGATVDAAGFAELAASAGVPVLEDVSHAVGARHGDHGVGRAGTATLVRLGPDELLEGWGDLGAVATSSSSAAARLREQCSGPPDAVPAEIAGRRLVHLERDVAERRAVSRALRAGLAGSAAEPLSQPEPASDHTGHRFVVRSADRDDLCRHLVRRGVDAEAPALAGPAPVAAELLALPAWAGMSAEQVRRVVVAAAAFAAPGWPGAGAVRELPTRP